MPTTIHIPAPLLEKAEMRARTLGISRDRLIVRALARELQQGQGWSPGFFERLRAVDEETTAGVDAMMSVIRQGRRV